MKQFTKATLPSVEEARKGIAQLKDRLGKLQIAIGVLSEQLSSLLVALPKGKAAEGQQGEGEPSWAAALQQMASDTVQAVGSVRQTLTRALADSLDALKVRASFIHHVNGLGGRGLVVLPS